jgi:NAD(P)-dependent dehydrogenase (short-subunit alcohol dehydrogenase family)
VFASSVVARIGVANHEAIAAAKGGVEALVRSAAATYAAQGVRVNAVAPGMTETPMTAGMLKMPAMREGAARQYPLGGVQTADQVAEVMAWLLGDGAARLTGQVIAVDGGFTTVRPAMGRTEDVPQAAGKCRGQCRQRSCAERAGCCRGR